jgi:uncharacterized protein (TIGR02646 family)
MIRARVDPTGAPTILSSPQADDAQSRAVAFFQRPLRERAQDTFAFDETIYAAEDVRLTLFELFAGKCAYCESPLTPSELLVDQFRPASGALDLEGHVDPDHYWWLAYTWENLYPCCAECRSFKGARFPVRGKRAKPGTTGKALSNERALLLDPRHDHPEQHLVFAEDGTVASITPEGQTTIDVLGLNRAQLVATRTAALAEVREEWDALAARLTSPTDEPDPAQVERLFSTALPYAATRRQFVNAWMQSRRKQVDAALQSTPEGISSVDQVAGDVMLVSKAERKRVKSAFTAREEEHEKYSVSSAAAPGEDYFGRTRRIERVIVHNFKVIRALDLQVPRLASDSASAPWLMLLGENGCGKSTLLQAVALALMGKEDRDALGLDASSFVRNGTRHAKVEVHLAGSLSPIVVEASRGSKQFTGELEPKMLLLAYGATRLLPRGSLTAPPIGGTVRARNMFDPFSPIGNATEWLLRFDRPRFDAIARGLKKLLDLEEGDRLMRNSRAKRIEVEAFGLRVPLEELSDGYQSVVALATDVMAVLLERWPSVEAAEGMVLIDELGAHLHPRWRMRIVASLREVFPRVQFLASTHDPLCLRGLGDGEVAVMQRDADDQIVAQTDLPSVAGLRVDQLLTSEHFGLNSTIDPELDELFAEYYQLKAKRKRTAAEERRHAELQARLDDLQVLGATRRDRIVLEAADDFLAKAGTLSDPDERLQLKESTKQQIASIWERAVDGEAVAP